MRTARGAPHTRVCGCNGRRPAGRTRGAVLDRLHERIPLHGAGASVPAIRASCLPRSSSPDAAAADVPGLPRSGPGSRSRSAGPTRNCPPDLSALSLAMGVQVADALREAGAAETMLKWPNDIMWRRRKLGGLLIQLKLEAGGAASVVVGLGLNVALPADVRERLATSGAAPVADLRRGLRRRSAGPQCAGRPPGGGTLRWPGSIRARGLRAVRESIRRARLAGRRAGAASRRRRAVSRARRWARTVTVRCA